MATQRYDALPRMNFSSPYVDLPGGLTITRTSWSTADFTV